jgi:hypothetical protein
MPLILLNLATVKRKIDAKRIIETTVKTARAILLFSSNNS